LLKYELGYGGGVANISEQGGEVVVVCETHLMQCRDTTTVSGSKAAMQPLIEGIRAYLEVKRHLGETAQDVAISGLLPNGASTVSPLIATHLGPILYGQCLVRYTLALLTGAPIEALKAISDNDMPALLKLAAETGQPVDAVAQDLGIWSPAA
jgi:hypothetical protein